MAAAPEPKCVVCTNVASKPCALDICEHVVCLECVPALSPKPMVASDTPEAAKAGCEGRQCPACPEYVEHFHLKFKMTPTLDGDTGPSDASDQQDRSSGCSNYASVMNTYAQLGPSLWHEFGCFSTRPYFGVPKALGPIPFKRIDQVQKIRESGLATKYVNTLKQVADAEQKLEAAQKAVEKSWIERGAAVGLIDEFLV